MPMIKVLSFNERSKAQCKRLEEVVVYTIEHSKRIFRYLGKSWMVHQSRLLR